MYLFSYKIKYRMIHSVNNEKRLSHITHRLHKNKFVVSEYCKCCKNFYLRYEVIVLNYDDKFFVTSLPADYNSAVKFNYSFFKLCFTHVKIYRAACCMILRIYYSERSATTENFLDV